jgi:hypothetical protein
MSLQFLGTPDAYKQTVKSVSNLMTDASMDSPTVVEDSSTVMMAHMETLANHCSKQPGVQRAAVAEAVREVLKQLDRVAQVMQLQRNSKRRREAAEKVRGTWRVWVGV